ncbi:breast carcinoma amplified sequence 2 [Gonapodya prolifera JEL478]|uniref:Breast carcinoma amplified sequence 2 n=1 Tax=Gonapodya prolifera (strain JEL478) TaxID=1344416 RepID=A0A139AJX9_GONPJ|nr:breast carcinoma amplified sequence 2 [Gonapodya prolifera JEL478]|eukprot:KXS17090.1 breast carcinoma amplified sequence 2 [Gonapodya prolifera JEL478]
MASEGGNVILDSLPYIDKEYEDECVRAEVDALIEEELQRRPARDAPNLPPEILLFESNPILAAELDRVERGQKLNAIDTSRYRLPKPPQDDDLEGWKKAVDNARAQLEHQYSRLINLELLNKFGPNAWKIHNFQLEATNASLQAKIDDYSRKIMELNKLRKLDQTREGQILRQLQAKWNEHVATHIQLETAYLGMELEVKLLEQQYGVVSEHS